MNLSAQREARKRVPARNGHVVRMLDSHMACCAATSNWRCLPDSTKSNSSLADNLNITPVFYECIYTETFNRACGLYGRVREKI